MTRRALAAAFAALAAGCAPPIVVSRPELAPPAAPQACHAVLWWHDASPAAEPKPPLGAPAAALKALLGDTSRTHCRELKSWQVVHDPEHLVMLSRVWRTELPVLWVALQHARSGEEGKRKLQLRLKARLQAGLFDTSEEPSPRTLETAPEGYEGALRTLFGSLRGLALQPPSLSIRPVDGPGTAEALGASRAADWKRAAALWEEAARSAPDGLRVLANAGVAAELAGDLERAHELESHLYDVAGGGLAAELKLLFVGPTRGHEREAQLNGLLALKRPPLASLSPGSTLAVLPLDNETPDLEADERVRAALASALEAAGYRPLRPQAVDERLKKEGVTMAGHLKALKWDKIGKRVQAEFLVGGSVEEFRVLPGRQVRARLSLIHAPTGTEVYTATVEGLDQTERPKDDAAGLVRLVGAFAEKAGGKTLSAEAKAAAERFAGPWPRSAR